MNKIILLSLLLVTFIAACVYTKAESIFNELQADATQTAVEAITIPNEQQNQPVQTEELLEEEVQELQIQAPDDTLQEAPLDNPLNTEEEIKKDQEALFLKEQDHSLVAEEIKEKISEEKITEKEKVDDIADPKNMNVQEQINALLVDNAIVFQRMSSNIANESKETLEKIAKIITDNPKIKIEIAGHTDAKGDDNFNQMISEQRANSVKNKLVELGVNAKRLKAKGYGKAMPLVPNDEDGYSVINRRVEFNITEE